MLEEELTGEMEDTHRVLGQSRSKDHRSQLTTNGSGNHPLNIILKEKGDCSNSHM